MGECIIKSFSIFYIKKYYKIPEKELIWILKKYWEILESGLKGGEERKGLKKYSKNL